MPIDVTVLDIIPSYVFNANLFVFFVVSSPESTIDSSHPIHSCKVNQVYCVLVLSKEAKEEPPQWQRLTTTTISHRQLIKSRTT